MMFNHTLISLTCGVQGHQQPGSQIHLHIEDKEEIQGPHATLVNLTLCLIGLLWASYKLHAISFVTILCFFTFFLPEYYFVLVNYSCRVIFIIYDNLHSLQKKRKEVWRREAMYGRKRFCLWLPEKMRSFDIWWQRCQLVKRGGAVFPSTSDRPMIVLVTRALLFFWS